MATRAEITSGLAEILEEVAGVNPDDVARDKCFTDDLHVDSLSMVEVVVGAEEKFGVKIPDNEVQNLKTVGDAVSYIEANHCKEWRRRRRHRARRDHPVGRGRRLHLGRHG